MAQCIFRVRIYSPRWGHDDSYEFSIDENKMEITSGVTRGAICKWREKKDPIWVEENDSIGNPLINILNNDHVYPPSVFVSALEAAWIAWRDGELDCKEIESEINILVEWINETSQNKPTTDFWNKIF